MSDCMYNYATIADHITAQRLQTASDINSAKNEIKDDIGIAMTEIQHCEMSVHQRADTIDASITTIDNKIDVIDNNIDIVKETTEDTYDEAVSIYQATGEIIDKIAELKVDTTNIESALSLITDKIDDGFASIQQQIEELESKVDTIDARTIVINSTLAGIASDCQTIIGKIDAIDLSGLDDIADNIALMMAAMNVMSENIDDIEIMLTNLSQYYPAIHNNVTEIKEKFIDLNESFMTAYNFDEGIDDDINTAKTIMSNAGLPVPIDPSLPSLPPGQANPIQLIGWALGLIIGQNKYMLLMQLLSLVFGSRQQEWIYTGKLSAVTAECVTNALKLTTPGNHNMFYGRGNVYNVIAQRYIDQLQIMRDPRDHIKKEGNNYDYSSLLKRTSKTGQTFYMTDILSESLANYEAYLWVNP